jgi:hypothetical protein
MSLNKKLIMHIIQGASKRGCKQWTVTKATKRKHQNRPVAHGKMPLPRKNGSNVMVAHSTHVLENTAAAKEETHLVKDISAPYLSVGNFHRKYKHFMKLTKN